MTKILIADANIEYNRKMCEFFSNQESFEVSYAYDGLNASKIIEAVRPDVVVLDLILSEKDGFELMSKYAVKDNKPYFFVCSCVSQDEYVNKAMKTGATYYMLKPVNFSLLKERITDTLVTPYHQEAAITVTEVQANKKYSKAIDEKISNVFIAMGMPAHIKGYQFLREAVKLVMDDPDIINSITKRLYPEVATKYMTSASKVERAIRHAIEVAWNRGKIDSLNSLFGFKVYGIHDKPTNGEFIALVADKMIMEL